MAFRCCILDWLPVRRRLLRASPPLAAGQWSVACKALRRYMLSLVASRPSLVTSFASTEQLSSGASP